VSLVSQNPNAFGVMTTGLPPSASLRRPLEGLFAIVFVAVGGVATFEAIVSPEPWLSGLILERLFLVTLVAASIAAGTLVTVQFLSRMDLLPRTSLALEPRADWKRLRGPLLTSILFAILAGAALSDFHALESIDFHYTTALGLFVANGWAPLIAWSIVALGNRGAARPWLPSKLSRRNRSSIERPMYILASYGIIGIFVTWVVFAPVPHAPIRIDGNMTDWIGIPGVADSVGDARLEVDGSSPEFDGFPSGSYPVILNVTDSGGRSAETSRTIVVPNPPPVARATFNVTGQNVTFDASQSSDIGGAVDSYLWDFNDSSTGRGVQVVHEYAYAGLYNVTLTVTDDEGAQAFTQLHVRVSGPNSPPDPRLQVFLTDYFLRADANGSRDRDGSITNYTWTFGDGSVSYGLTATHPYALNGTYLLRLTVTDNGSANASLSYTLHVPNLAPVPRFSTSIDALSVLFDGRNSTDDVGIANYHWDFGDGTALTGPLVRHQYTSNRNYTIRLAVTDVFGYTATVSRVVPVFVPPDRPPLPPVVSFRTVVDNLFVSFVDAGTYDPAGQIVQYAWDFGDGTVASTLTTEHLYASPGIYVARLTILDSAGLVSTASDTLDLRGAALSLVPPVPRISLRISGTDVKLDGSSSTSEFGKVVRYRWIFPTPPGGLDLHDVKVVRSGAWVFFYAAMAGNVFPIPVSISFYLETNSNRPGTMVGGIHASFVARLSGSDNHLYSGGLYWYFDRNLPGIPGNWLRVSTIPAAASIDAVEARVSTSLLLISSQAPLRVTCVIEYADSIVDILDTPITV
jgi:PKD repeat protein